MGPRNFFLIKSIYKSALHEYQLCINISAPLDGNLGTVDEYHSTTPGD